MARAEKGPFTTTSDFDRWVRNVWQVVEGIPRGHVLTYVVNAQGRISFPADSAGYQRQKRRLEEEGVVFVKGSINLDQFGYQGALDHLLWSEPL